MATKKTATKKKPTGNKPAGKRPAGKKPAGKRAGGKGPGGKGPGGKGDARPGRKATRDGPRRDEAPHAKSVGGARNEHGTRISRRVECTRCGKVDHVPWTKKDVKGALCRSCAADVLKLYEVGTKKRAETREVECNLCGIPFALPVTVEDDGDLLCPSCLRGFTVWQGDLDVPWEERTRQRSEARPSGTLLRRRSPEG